VLVTVSVWPGTHHAEFMQSIKAVVPGARVSYRNGRAEVSVEDHGAHALEARLVEADLRYDWQTPAKGPPVADIRTRLARRVEEGVVKPELPGLLTAYQLAGLDFSLARSGAHYWWPCGSGKTIGGVLWSLAHEGPHVVVTRSAALFTWYREVRARTNVEPLVWLPPSLRRKSYEDVSVYAARVRTPFVIVSWESLPAAVNELALLRPNTVAYDEIHRAKSHKRWKAIPQSDGTTGFEKLDNIAGAACELSKLARYRLALTATPIRDRVRDLWAQLDLVDPGKWGKYWDWAARYCAARPGAYGGMDDTGHDNLDELEYRLRYVVHRVHPSEVSDLLPPKRRQVVYLPPSEQNKAVGSWVREMKQAVKAGGEHAMEVKLAEAASRKRRWVLDTLADAVAGNQKVVVLTGRRADVDVLGVEARKELTGALVHATHGEDSSEERDAICQSWLSAPAPAVLIATGDSIGESLNLQDADLLVVAMLPWTPGQVTQYEGRVCRLGQVRPVLIQYIIAEGTVDERVAELLLGKLPTVAALTGDSDVEALRAQLVGTDNQDGLMDEVAAMLAAMGELSEIVIGTET